MEFGETPCDDGYHVYFDYFFSTGPLLEDLLKRETSACGTTQKGVIKIPIKLQVNRHSLEQNFKGGGLHGWVSG